MWVNIAVLLMIVISTAESLSDRYQIKNGTYNSYLECLSDTFENVPMSALHDRAVKVLSKTSLKALWLPLRRRHLTGWFWLSNQFYGAKLSRKPYKIGRDCGVLRAADFLLDDTMCNTLYRKYLCQSKGESCPANRQDCLNHKGRAYWLYSSVDITWYDARTRCSQKGQELSTLPEESRQVVMEWLQSTITRFFNVWVGLRKSDYFYGAQSTSSSEIFHWGEGRHCPCESPYKCVIMQKKTPEEFSWIPQSCNTTFPFFCIVNPTTDNVTIPQNMTKGGLVTTQHTDEPSKAIIVALPAVGLVLIVVIVLCLVHCVHQKMGESGKTKDQQGCTEAKEEAVPLTENQKNKRSIQNINEETFSKTISISQPEIKYDLATENQSTLMPDAHDMLPGRSDQTDDEMEIEYTIAGEEFSSNKQGVKRMASDDNLLDSKRYRSDLEK